MARGQIKALAIILAPLAWIPAWKEQTSWNCLSSKTTANFCFWFAQTPYPSYILFISEYRLQSWVRHPPTPPDFALYPISLGTFVGHAVGFSGKLGQCFLFLALSEEYPWWWYCISAIFMLKWRSQENERKYVKNLRKKEEGKNE